MGIFLLDLIIWFIAEYEMYHYPHGEGSDYGLGFVAIFILAISIFLLFIQNYNNSESRITTVLILTMGLVPVIFSAYIVNSLFPWLGFYTPLLIIGLFIAYVFPRKYH